jgi:hypothetical protein
LKRNSQTAHCQCQPRSTPSSKDSLPSAERRDSGEICGASRIALALEHAPRRTLTFVGNGHEAIACLIAARARLQSFQTLSAALSFGSRVSTDVQTNVPATNERQKLSAGGSPLDPCPANSTRQIAGTELLNTCRDGKEVSPKG